jgi:serine/threonine-protein kinase
MEAAARALALDDFSPEAHLAKAQVLMYHDWNFRGAEQEFRRTLALNQNYSTAHQWYGELLTFTGRHAESVREEEAALELDPLSAIVHHELASSLRDAGRYDDAVREFKKTLEIDPQLVAAHWEMAVAFQRQGKLEEAIRALKAGAEGVVKEYHFNPAMISAINDIESAYTNTGSAGYFRQSLKFHRHLPRPSYYLARDYTQLGEKETAITELKRSYQNHDPEALWMFIDPELEPLRGDPRFQSLVRAIGFQR